MRPAWLVLVAACGGTTPAPVPEAAPAAPEAPAAADTAGHFVGLAEAKDALIRGDVAGAQSKLKALAEEEPPDGMPSEWAPFLELQRAAMRSGVYATTPEGVGRGIAGAAHVCGECHVTLGAQVDRDMAPVPPDRTGLLAHMHRHVWAADRMWQGLVSPSDGAWADASAALAEAPLYEAPEGKLMGDAARAFAMEVTESGTATLTAASPTRRVELYGDFLGACGSCHVVTSGGPGASAR